MINYLIQDQNAFIFRFNKSTSNQFIRYQSKSIYQLLIENTLNCFKICCSYHGNYFDMVINDNHGKLTAEVTHAIRATEDRFEVKRIAVLQMNLKY